MRQSLKYLFIATLVWGGTCSKSSCSQPRQAVPAVTVLRSDSTDLTTLKTLLGLSETTTTEHFVLVHEPGAGYPAKVGRALEYAYQQFYGVFAHAGFELPRSQGHLVWICFPHQSDFNKYTLQVERMDLSWLDSYYSTLTNRVAIVQADPRVPEGEDRPLLGDEVRASLASDRQPGQGVLPMAAAKPRLDIARLTHELAHQLSFNSGLQKRGVMYPVWVSEGLTTNFEFEWPAGTGLDRCNAARCDCVLEMRDEGGLIPLRQFVVQTRVPADTYVGRRHYAQAWAFFQFIVTLYPGNLRVYLEQLASKHPGNRDPRTLLAEFTRAFGPPEDLEDAWNVFLDRQEHALTDVSPAPALPDPGASQ